MTRTESPRPKSPYPPDTALLVQFSDSHLARDPETRLRGVVVQECLQALFESASNRFPEVDLLLLSGDISHDGSAESYRHVERLTRSTGWPVRFLPGNHDKLENMERCLPAPSWPAIDELGAWRLISLSTHLAGSEAGYLDRAQLEALEEALFHTSAHPKLIALHHPPIDTGSPWLDRIGLNNAEAFREIVSSHPAVRAVLFGHAHQAIDDLRDGVRWLGCPATCVQFRPNSGDSYSDTRLPGYRWLRLHSDGTLETGVERLAAWPAGSTPAGLRET